MMKQRLIALTILAITTPTLAQNLPFIGERSFNFMGGSGTGYTIDIQENGDTHIQFHGTFGSSSVYQGKYQAYLPIINHNDKLIGYYHIKGDKIYELNHQKELDASCQKADAIPCVSELDPMDK